MRMKAENHKKKHTKNDDKSTMNEMRQLSQRAVSKTQIIVTMTVIGKLSQIKNNKKKDIPGKEPAISVSAVAKTQQHTVKGKTMCGNNNRERMSLLQLAGCIKWVFDCQLPSTDTNSFAGGTHANKHYGSRMYPSIL